MRPKGFLLLVGKTIMLSILKRLVASLVIALVLTCIVLFALLAIGQFGPQPIDVSSEYSQEIDGLIESGKDGFSLDDSDRLNQLMELHNQIVNERIAKFGSGNSLRVREKLEALNKELLPIFIFIFLITFIYFVQSDKK